MVMKRYLKIFLWLFILIFLSSAYFIFTTPKLEPRVYGVTFAPQAAEIFGLDWQDVYVAVLDDLGVRDVRISAYWSEIEAERDSYDFSRLDFQVSEAEKRDAKVILVLGRKVPRWPECHIPEWAKGFDIASQDKALYKYMEQVVTRYKDSSAVVMWQVENEPFLPFGICPDFGASSVDGGIELVRRLDDRPILITDSGELSIWVRAADRGDIFGTTMYRTVWNKVVGQFTYPLPPSFFRLKRGITELFVGVKPMIVVELQGEPWLAKPIHQSSIEEHYTVMSPEIFEETLEYAEASGFDIFYLWGVEWWYWLKQEGQPEIWDIAKGKIYEVR
jgi:hypothetical protein